MADACPTRRGGYMIRKPAAIITCPDLSGCPAYVQKKYKTRTTDCTSPQIKYAKPSAFLLLWRRCPDQCVGTDEAGQMYLPLTNRSEGVGQKSFTFIQWPTYTIRKPAVITCPAYGQRIQNPKHKLYIPSCGGVAVSANKKLIERGGSKNFYLHPMADVHDKKTRSYNMSRIRAKNTKPEMLVRRSIYLFSKVAIEFFPIQF